MYGLSANPPHLAHMKIIRELAKVFDLVYVFAVDNPFKYGNPDWLQLDKRSGMVEMMIDLINARNVIHSPEFSNSSAAISAQTILESNPDDKLFIALGTDALRGIPRWTNLEILKTSVSGVVQISRPGEELYTEPDIIDIPVRTLEIITSDISSSKIRLNIKQIYALRDTLLETLPEEIVYHIISNNLYN